MIVFCCVALFLPWVKTFMEDSSCKKEVRMRQSAARISMMNDGVPVAYGALPENIPLFLAILKFCTQKLYGATEASQSKLKLDYWKPSFSTKVPMNVYPGQLTKQISRRSVRHAFCLYELRLNKHHASILYLTILNLQACFCFNNNRIVKCCTVK